MALHIRVPPAVPALLTAGFVLLLPVHATAQDTTDHQSAYNPPLAASPGTAAKDGDAASVGVTAKHGPCDSRPAAAVNSFFHRLTANTDADDQAHRVARFKAFNATFTTRPLARAVLGPSWDTASEPARAQYVALFHFYFMDNYLDLAAQASRSGHDGMIARTADNGETVVAPTGQDAGSSRFSNIEIYVRPATCRLALVDVHAGRLSLAKMIRSEFQSILHQSGLAGLMERLRNRAHKSPMWEMWQASR